MHSFARLITLPLLCGTIFGTAHAEAVSPEQATELLAKTQTIDRKCNFLTATEQSDLSGLVARAEIALATQQSVADASAALARGKALGKAAACSDVERAEVSAILNAAKTASLQAPVSSPEQAAAEPQPTLAPEPQTAQITEPEKIEQPAKALQPAVKKRLVAAQTKKLPAKKLEAKATPALASYAALTQRYYLQRRCGTMGSQAINALYQNVVATHQRTLQAYGKATTAAAMRRAEAQASAQNCS